MKTVAFPFLILITLAFIAKVHAQGGEKIITVSTNSAKLTENVRKDSRVIKVLMSGDKLELLEILFPEGFKNASRYKVRSDELEDYISSYFIKSTVEIQGMESNIREMELAELNNKELERKRIVDSTYEASKIDPEIKKINEVEQIRKNDSIADAMLKLAKLPMQQAEAKRKADYQKYLSARKVKFHEKYGKEIGEKIANQRIWIGMTEEMLLESWGKPEDINQTVTRYRTHKQYVYGSGQYVYVENGIVESWQN